MIETLHAVATLADLPGDGVYPAELPTGERVCLVRYGDTISAFLDECPHQGMALSAGEVLSDGNLECVWHGARFDCHTGAVRRGPAEQGALAFTVRVEGQRILVGREPPP